MNPGKTDTSCPRNSSVIKSGECIEASQAIIRKLKYVQPHRQ